MKALEGSVVWVTGAGSGIGQAVALELAAAGGMVVLTGRRVGTLEQTAGLIADAGGKSAVMPGDLTQSGVADGLVSQIEERFGRLDILVNNAGGNIAERAWKDLTFESIDALISANLSAAFHCAAAALRPMRRAGRGLLVQTASWAGKFIHPVSGPVYTAAKHGVVAMSQSINMEEYRAGIRSTVILPAEVSTQILDRRPVPPTSQERAEMLQPKDFAEVVLFITTRPDSVCLNEIVVSARLNKFYER